jgi:hypothetical protein
MWSGWRSTVALVQPETVIRWQRTAWRWYWSWRSRRSRGQGRPPVSMEVKDLIRRLAHENRRWGSMRIAGEFRKLGYEISAQSVRRYRPDARVRPPSQSWRTFLRNHAPHIWAADFFTVQTLTFKTLFVFLFISSRRSAGSRWPPSRVRVGGRLRYADTEILLAPHNLRPANLAFLHRCHLVADRTLVYLASGEC